MFRQTNHTCAFVLLVAALLTALAGVANGQQTPVAAMYSDDQKRDQALAPSFLIVDGPAAKGATQPLKVYLSVGDLERALDSSQYRPGGVIVPTNTDLVMAATTPATQRVIVARVQKHPDVMRDLEDQIAAYRKKAPAASGPETGLLRIGIDMFHAQLPRAGTPPSGAAFPRHVCMIATNFAQGGAIDRRELFTQDRVRKGIAACLSALDAAGVQTVIMPLMGAASSGTQSNDAMYEGQRLLKECRLLNSVAGMTLGFHDFASSRRNIREIGVVQWDQEIGGMFSVLSGSKATAAARKAYLTYAEQIKQAFRKGLAGEKTTAADIGGCNATFNAQ